MRPVSRTSRTIAKETEFATSPDRLFDAFVEPVMLRQWLVESASVDLRPRGQWVFDFGEREGGRIGGSYVVVERPWRLVWTWNEWGIDQQGNPLRADPCTDPPWAVTVCDIAIADEHGSARLNLNHYGYPDMPDWDDLYTGVSLGWDELLEKLRPVVERQASTRRSATITANIPARYQIE